MVKVTDDSLEGIFIEIRKIMLVRGLEFKKTSPGMCGLFTKCGKEMEEPQSLAEWGERLLEHKEHISEDGEV